jgi:hypothetical protein
VAKPTLEKGTPLMDEKLPKPGPQPIFKLTSEGEARAAIWQNFNQKTQEEYLTISFYRTYRDAQGHWQNSHNFRPKDLPDLVDLAQRAHELIEHEQHQRTTQQQENKPAPRMERGPEMDR